MAERYDFYVHDSRKITFNLTEPIMREDNRVTDFVFHIPKVLNELEVSDWAWWLVFVNAKKEKYSIALTLSDDPERPLEYNLATYTVDYAMSIKAGSVQFALEAINAGTGGAIDNEWHTLTYETKVKETLQGNQAEYAETESDIISALLEEVRTKMNQVIGGATPTPVASVSAMTDPSKLYLLTTDGEWYYYNGSAWVSGGVYGTGVVDAVPTQGSTNAVSSGGVYEALHDTDPTLSQSGQAADAKKTGDKLSTLNERIDKYDSPFNNESNIVAYTNGIVKIIMLDSTTSNYSAYRIATIRKNSAWHLYIGLKGYNGESWVLVDNVESPYDAQATYPRVETIISKHNKYAVVIDWNYVKDFDIAASSLTIDVKNSIVFKPFTDALANIKTNKANITTLTANQQQYNSIFADTVPSDILGLVDISIYNTNVSNYEKYRVRNVGHNSSWHIQLTVQGYNGSSWVGVDEVEVRASSAPSPVPAVEVYDSKYHRLTVTIVWALMGDSVTRTSLDYELKHSVVNKTQIALRQDTNRALADATIPPFELTDHVGRTKVVTVKKDGSGNYTSIGAAYAAITDSAFDNQYEIIVYPGTYNENNLMPPPYTHTHGIFPMQTIVDSTGSEDVDNSVFDMGHAPCKLSNMWIKSATKYCVHQDVELYAVTLVCENLYCEKLPGGNQLNNACVGMGADFGGAKFVWRGCTFVNGEVGMHTNPNQDPNANQHLIFEDCTFVNAYLWLGVAGNTYGEYVCDIRGCKTNKGNAGMRLKFGAPISGIPVNFPWQIIGGNNNLAPKFDNTSDTSVSDYWDAISTTEKKYVVATASITKGKFVSDSGSVCNASTPKQNVVGIAVASGSTDNVIPVWSGAFPYIGTAGEYGIDANGELSVSASIKTGYVVNNIYYPFNLR